ncbi:hypothetical protein RSAG8_08929, partial [Rhizoctonia solani AG-8 WAC10335]
MVEASKHKELEARHNPDRVNASQAIKDEDNVQDDVTDAATGSAVIGIDDIEALERSTEAEAEAEVEDDDHETRNAIKIVSAIHGNEDEQYLQQFYMPGNDCSTSVLDNAFSSPPHEPCIEEPLEDDINAFNSREAAQGLRQLLIEPCPKEPVVSIKPRAKYRPTDERAQLEEHLLTWKQSIYEAEFSGTGMSANHIITDKILAAISRLLPPLTLESLEQTTPPWPRKSHSKWGASLLAVVHAFDAPAQTAERKVERIRLRQVVKSKGIIKKGTKVIKSEDIQLGSKGRKRVEDSGGQVASQAVKKRRTLATAKIADSALSAKSSSQPQVLDSPPVPQTTPTRPYNNSKLKPGTPSR